MTQGTIPGTAGTGDIRSHAAKAGHAQGMITLVVDDQRNGDVDAGRSAPPLPTRNQDRHRPVSLRAGTSRGCTRIFAPIFDPALIEASTGTDHRNPIDALTIACRVVTGLIDGFDDQHRAWPDGSATGPAFKTAGAG